jgi:aspartate 1-decarboxylase
MKIQMLQSKIHQAVITDANINYEGSITIDEEILQKADLLEHQAVEIANINNGERFKTYIIKGTYGSKEICINGAGARKVTIGDKIIIMAYASFEKNEINNYSPTIVLMDENNEIKKG